MRVISLTVKEKVKERSSFRVETHMRVTLSMTTDMVKDTM
jgi:hypothetical protein